MIRKSLNIIKYFAKKTNILDQDIRLSDSYQLSQSQIAAILHKPAIIQKFQDNPVSTIIQQQKQIQYGLPKKNQPFPLTFDQEDLRQIAQTPTQNLYELLKLDGDSSFQQYLSSINRQFHHELDLYGDQLPPAAIDLNSLEFKDLITTNSDYLTFLRKKFLVNPNIPGTIQLEDPNNFLQLRPIEQFRHTPLIPISESAMKKFKQQMDERHNRAFYFSVKTETMINVGLFILSVGVVLTLISHVRKGSDKKALQVMRLKHQRMVGEQRTEY